jgi:hypothetical protein
VEKKREKGQFAKKLVKGEKEEVVGCIKNRVRKK